ncbi:hypothetical protein Tco_1568607 [Tanacetum coccineum]
MYYMSPSKKRGDHIDEFNKLILDLATIDIEIEDEDQTLMLLTSLLSSYENLWKHWEGQIIQVKLILVKVYGLSQGVELDSDSFDDEGKAYFGEALVVVGNDKMTELVMNSSGSYHMTYKRDFLYDFKGFDGGSVQLGDNRTCTIKGIEKGSLEKEGYTMKIQMGRIKVIKGCRVMMTRIRKKNCVYALETKVTTFGVQKHEDSKQVEFKQLGSKQVRFKYLGVKQVGFKQLGPSVETGVHGVHVDKRVWFEVELQGAQENHKDEVFQVSNDDTAVAQKWLEDNQLEENTNTDCLVKEQEKLHLGIKTRANIMVTGVHGKEDAEGNVAEKKKVKESLKANLGKLLKYNAWSIRWSSVRGSSMRKRC